MALLDRGVPILLALARVFTIGERSKKFGIEFSISWCSLFKWEGRKKRMKKKAWF